MAITLNWPASNAGVATAIRIYVSTSRIPDDTLPAPIATLAGTETSFVWTPPTDNTVYYFRIAFDRGADTYLGDNQIYGYFANTGPGPQTLSRGTWEAGYFGRVIAADIATQSALLTALGFSGGGGPHADVTISHYYKFALSGKIIFVPCGSIRWSITWDQIYALGLMYGVDSTGLELHPTPSNLVGVNQKKIVALNGYNFLARTFKGSNRPTNVLLADWNTPTAWVDGCEWDLTMGRINTNGTLAYNTSSLWDDNGVQQVAPTAIAPTNQGTITQHITGTVINNRISLVRGPIGNIDGVLQGTPQGQVTTWTPLLELQF
jgi:hypothetical protein